MNRSEFWFGAPAEKLEYEEDTAWRRSFKFETSEELDVEFYLSFLLYSFFFLVRHAMLVKLIRNGRRAACLNTKKYKSYI